MKQTSVLEIKMVRKMKRNGKIGIPTILETVPIMYSQSMKCSKMNAHCVISKGRHRMQTDFINRFRYTSSSE